MHASVQQMVKCAGLVGRCVCSVCLVKRAHKCGDRRPLTLHTAGSAHCMHGMMLQATQSKVHVRKKRRQGQEQAACVCTEVTAHTMRCTRCPSLQRMHTEHKQMHRE